MGNPSFRSVSFGRERRTRVEQWSNEWKAKREILAGPRLNLRADSIRGINIDRPRDRRRENVPRSITPQRRQWFMNWMRYRCSRRADNRFAPLSNVDFSRVGRCFSRPFGYHRVPRPRRSLEKSTDRARLSRRVRWIFFTCFDASTGAGIRVYHEKISRCE